MLPVVFANLYLSKEWIGFISPLSWLNLLLLYGKICKKSPSFSQIIIVTAVLLPVLSVVSLKGMRQRLAVAQAIMEDPDFLILDEPFNGLDNQGVVEMRNIFLEFKQEGKVIIVASHNSEDIKVLCDHVHSMEAGNLKIIR